MKHASVFMPVYECSASASRPSQTKRAASNILIYSMSQPQTKFVASPETASNFR